ncbi:IclR family transcriptional regulator [Spirillospora sp. CA-255316]
MIETVESPVEVAPERDSKSTVQSSASKTLTVLEALIRAHGATIGVTEVAAEAGVPKSTAHRLLKTLEEHGFVGRSGPRYRAGSSLFELVEAVQWSEFGELRDAAPQPLSWLFARSEAIAVHLAVLRDTSVLYLDKITRPAGTRVPSRVGGRFPATCTALGKSMLAFSPQPVVQRILDRPMARPTPYSVVYRHRFVKQLLAARELGYAVDCEESCHGILCVAAPVINHGRVVAAVSLCTPAVGLGRATEKRVGSFGRLAVEAADQVRDLLPTS